MDVGVFSLHEGAPELLKVKMMLAGTKRKISKYIYGE